MKYFNFKKLTAMALTAIMAVSAMSVSAMAQEECDVETYAMSDENLDAEILDEAECAVFLIENDEIKQIIPVTDAGADVILTLERGVAFWVDSYHGAYYGGCVKTGSTYTSGYILSSFVR